MNILYVATLPSEIQKSFFNIIIHILSIIYVSLPQKKTNSNCCTPALSVCLLLFSASYYLHSPSTARLGHAIGGALDMLRLAAVACCNIG